MEVSPKPVSRRRTREEVQQAVRTALVEMLAERPFKDVTVDELARRAGLSRTAFYFYYPDKNEVLKECASDAAAEMYADADRWWHGEGDPRSLIRTAVQGVVDVYERHEHLMRVVQEVSTYDAEMGSPRGITPKKR